MTRTWHLAISSSIETGKTRLFDAEIDASITDLRYSTRIDGGYEGMDVGLSTGGWGPLAGPLETPVELPYRAHVELWDGDAKLWEGRADYRELGADGRVTAFTCHGYLEALGDDWVRDTDTTAITNGEALQYAIETYAPYLRIGSDEQFVLPTVNISRGLRALYKLAPGYVAEIVSRLGGASNHLYDVQVWDDQTVWMQPRVPPASGADYVIPFDPRYVTWSEDPSEMASEVSVEFQVTVYDPSTGEQTGVTLDVFTAAENTTFLDTWGFTRKIMLAIGEASASEAEALAYRELATRSEPTIQSTVFLDANSRDLLRAASGASMPFTLVRSGEWVRIADRDPLPIVSTTVDLTAMSATYELGARDPSLPRNQVSQPRNRTFILAALLDPYYGRRRGT